MCGIAGHYDRDGGASAELAERLASALAHRGPDGAGSFGCEHVALSMRRLAIIDPAHGHQPLTSEDGRIVAIFNGEIYNHRELRGWVEGRGHRLRSGSDGEVLPHLYEELGWRFVERLNGIFAIAIWDREERRLHLMRDRFGVKPLYWTGDEKSISFASELKALVAADVTSRRLDYTALGQFLSFRFVPSPLTLVEGVRKLAPATVLTCDPAGISERCFWEERPAALRRDRDALIEEYSAAFERAVVRQMMSDRPIGVMLSGGVDSGAITAVLGKHATTVRTFTVGFTEGGEDTNEIPLASETARLFGAEHESRLISASDYLAALPEALQSLDEPVGSSSALAVRFVTELMRPSVPVALCGQGADEPQAGYWRHLGTKLAQLLRRVPGARLLARGGGRVGSVRLQRGLAALAADGDLDLLMSAYWLLNPGEQRALLQPHVLQRMQRGRQPGEIVEALRSRVTDLSPLGQMLYVDTRLWLPDELLLIADKLSMASSVELRVPFLDNDLVMLAETMHPNQRLRGLTRKSLHKRAMLKWVPREIAYRKERGWQTPVDRWLRSDLRPLVDEVLLGDGGLCSSLFDASRLRGLIVAHADMRADHTRELFCLLSLGLWAREFGVSA